MGKHEITKEEARLLDWDQVEGLRRIVNDELYLLNETEKLLYARRRELELELYPEFALPRLDYPIKEERPKPQSPKPTPTPTPTPDLRQLLKQAARAGVDITKLFTK